MHAAFKHNLVVSEHEWINPEGSQTQIVQNMQTLNSLNKVFLLSPFKITFSGFPKLSVAYEDGESLLN